MTVSRILQTKGVAVVTATPEATLIDIARLLDEKRIGAVVIINLDGGIAGILSERDIVRAIARNGVAVMEHAAATVMTQRVHVCSPADKMDEIMGLMTEQRIRHLPVVSQGRLEGIISIGDVVKRRIEETEAEAIELRHYITGR